MANINLLPWREERRNQLKQQFFVVLACAAVLGAGVVFLYDMSIQKKIEFQRKGSEFIKAETAKLDKDIQEIEDIKKQRERLLERMEVIQNLQGNRSVIVHLFDEMVRVVPDGVYFTSVEKKGGKFHIEGVADANNRVSNLMRNFEKSAWFKNANLARVTAQDDADSEESTSTFKLSVSEDAPKDK